MRRTLLVGAAMTAAALSVSPPAHALFGVGDIVSDPGLTALQAQSNAATAGSWATQASNMTSTISTLTSQLRTVQQTLALITNPVSLLQTGAGLLTGDSQSPLGQDASATLGLASGAWNLASAGGQIAGQIRNSTNFYLTPSSLAGGAMSIPSMLLNRANQTAGLQALVQQQYASVTQRICGLEELQAEVNRGGTIQQMTALNARINSEMSFVQAQQLQAQQLQTLAVLQAQQQDQQFQQRGQLDHDTALADAVSRSGGLVSFTAPVNPQVTNVSSASAYPVFGATQ